MPDRKQTRCKDCDSVIEGPGFGCWSCCSTVCCHCLETDTHGDVDLCQDCAKADRAESASADGTGGEK
jgi:hypothetical protein